MSDIKTSDEELRQFTELTKSYPYLNAVLLVQYMDIPGGAEAIKQLLQLIKSRDQQIASERDMWKRRAAKWKKALETSEAEHLEECQQIALETRKDFINDLLSWLDKTAPYVPRRNFISTKPEHKHFAKKDFVGTDLYDHLSAVKQEK